MADIVLAEVSGQGWLVRGEQYIDDLLGNTLAPHVSIEVVTCESKSAVVALWQAEGGDDPAFMWLIHPGILNRAKGVVAPMTVAFAPWSAALEQAGAQTIELAARVAEQSAAGVVLVRCIPSEPPPMAAEMADLRSGLIEAALLKAGIAAERITRETVGHGEPDHIRLVVSPA